MSTAVQPGQGSAARAVFNAMHRGQPDVVASCATTEDVVAAIKRRSRGGPRVAVRGGGHSIAGLSAIDGGMLIDLAPMNGVEVDAERAHRPSRRRRDLERGRQRDPAARARRARRRGLRHRRRRPHARRRLRLDAAQVRALVRQPASRPRS